MAKLIENQKKIKFESCHSLLHLLKSSIEGEYPLHIRYDSKYYWSDCQAFKDYVHNINNSTDIKIEVKCNHIKAIGTTVKDGKPKAYYLQGHDYDLQPTDEYIINPSYKHDNH